MQLSQILSAGRASAPNGSQPSDAIEQYSRARIRVEGLNDRHECPEETNQRTALTSTTTTEPSQETVSPARESQQLRALSDLAAKIPVRHRLSRVHGSTDSQNETAGEHTVYSTGSAGNSSFSSVTTKFSNRQHQSASAPDRYGQPATTARRESTRRDGSA